MNNEEKLNKLVEILQEYVKYLKTYSEVKVEVSNLKLHDKTKYDIEYIRVTYHKVKLPYLSPNGFECIEFPMSDLDKRLEHYRNKLKNIKEKNNG